MSSASFTEAARTAAGSPTSSGFAEIDAAVERVAAHKQAWVEVPIPQRIELLRRCLAGVLEVAENWVRDMVAVKGLRPDENLAGEEWLAGPATTARNTRLLIGALEAGGQPRPPRITTRPGGQLVARVLPATLSEKLLFGGVTADVWIEPGKPASQGRIYREPGGKGAVCLVLGAGNVSSIPPMDTLYKLFVENEVVVLKMNPVNAAAGPHIERAFKSLVDAGFLCVVYGGADVGAHLANHPKVDSLHVTGSDRTYDAIVWGAPEEQAQRKAANNPVNTRPFSAELGCVTPVLVVPGDWSDSDLEFQARNVASMVAQNGSFNCNAAKVIVTAKSWKLRAAFLEKFERALGRAAPRKAYYPGAERRYQGFMEHYPQAKVVGEQGPDIVPWTIIPDVAPDPAEYALSNEAFCGVVAQVALPAESATEFLSAAVDFANESCWGTLSCMILIDEATQRSAAQDFDRALERLRYGGIAINAWAGFNYGLVSPTWGAFPGHPNTDIRSGTGVVHNTFLFDHPQKSVLRASFRIRPTPPWFFDHRNLRRTGQRFTRLEAHPSLLAFLSAASAGMRG
jgi:acyl-CoA reductase-like NAD-dependent aldehyde dehydrogenase